MAQAGVDLATLASILGHGSIRVVQKYVHPTSDHKKQAMLKFEQALIEAERSAFPQASTAVN
jgi:site-specific recombinase XerD